MQKYLKWDKPQMDEQKKRLITQKLNLQKQSFNEYRFRQKNNDFFVNYTQNPFLNLNPHLKSVKKQSTQQSINKNNQKQTNQLFVQTKNQQNNKNKVNDRLHDIIYEYNHMKQKQPKPQFVDLQQQVKHTQRNADLLSTKIIDITKNKRDFQFFNNKKRIDNKQIVKGIFQKKDDNNKSNKNKQKQQHYQNAGGQNVKRIRDNPILAKLPDNPFTFQDIVQMQDQNFFLKQYPKLDIFKVAFDQEQKYLMGKQLLKKQCFNFTSMVQKVQKVKIPIYRDLSRLGRKCLFGISTGRQDIFDHVDSAQLSLKINSLKFIDVMSVATARFNPQFIYKITNSDFQHTTGQNKQQTSSYQQDVQICYQDNQQNIGLRYYNQAQQQQQIINYMNLQLHPSQLRFRQTCQFYKKNLLNNLKMKQNLISSTIKDKYLHKDFNINIKQQLMNFVKLDEKDVDIQRIIRVNKANKNKNVQSKMMKIIDIMQRKQQNDIILSKLGIVEQDIDDLVIPQKQKANPTNNNKTKENKNNNNSPLKLKPKTNVISSSPFSLKKPSSSPIKLKPKNNLQQSNIEQKLVVPYRYTDNKNRQIQKSPIKYTDKKKAVYSDWKL